jgi:transducin (beta)-like 1
LKWNKKGDVLLTISVDKSAIVWDPSSGEVRQQFEFHTAPILDVDWRDDTTFATCSNDKHIFVCQLGSLAPLVQFTGHKVCFFFKKIHMFHRVKSIRSVGIPQALI